MPARKPKSLIKRHSTNKEKADRAAAEQALTPVTKLTLEPPTMLKGHEYAAALWTRLVRLYAETEGEVATAFDMNSLVKYCLVEEELIWLEKQRLDIFEEVEALKKAIAKKPGAKASEWQWKVYISQQNQYSGMLARMQGFDARLDGKRKLAHTLEQSLYLNPRSRAGVAPPEKEKPDDSDPMERLLGE